jgi:hypothetical protein
MANLVGRILFFLHEHVSERIAYSIYAALFRVSPKLIPEPLLPKPIEPLSLREFTVDSMLLWRDDPKFANVYASLDDRRIEIDDIPRISDEDLERVLWHGIALKPRNRAERRREKLGSEK